jgi:hypothetical protein
LASNYSRGFCGLKYKAYRKVQAAVDGSQFWEAKAGSLETSNREARGFRYGKPFERSAGFNNREAPGNAIFEAHTYTRFGTGNEHFCHAYKRACKGNVSSGETFGYKVYGRNNTYTLSLG